MEVENDVKLADIPEVSVQDFDKQVNHLQRHELIIRAVHTGDEEERRIPLVDHLQDVNINTTVRSCMS